VTDGSTGLRRLSRELTASGNHESNSHSKPRWWCSDAVQRLRNAELVYVSGVHLLCNRLYVYKLTSSTAPSSPLAAGFVRVDVVLSVCANKTSVNTTRRLRARGGRTRRAMGKQARTTPIFYSQLSTCGQYETARRFGQQVAHSCVTCPPVNNLHCTP